MFKNPVFDNAKHLLRITLFNEHRISWNYRLKIKLLSKCTLRLQTLTKHQLFKEKIVTVKAIFGRHFITSPTVIFVK